MVAIARLVIAAPASGCGKTTVACGLMAALRGRGLVVSGHKVGPDYIDPGYHALATGRPPRNLDPFLSGEDLIAPMFRHGAAGAQIAVIEGVMGLFDGAANAAGTPGRRGATADLAAHFGLPVVLVIDVARQAQSAAAVVRGFENYREIFGEQLGVVREDYGVLDCVLQFAHVARPDVGFQHRCRGVAQLQYRFSVN